MRLLNIGEKGLERAAALDSNDDLRDISSVVGQINASAITPDMLDALRNLDLSQFAILDDTLRIGPCLSPVKNFFCIGLNYAEHAREAGATPPKEPIIFSKATSALAGPNDSVAVPPNSRKMDWEVELGVVIGQPCWQVSEANALSHVAGYCTINDLSERAWQLEHGGQWIKGKSAPGFGPIGPWLLTADEVPDPQNLDVWLSVNGDVQQNSSTADMIFSVAEIISYMSRFMRLMPGDIIATGTPQGVGMGQTPQRFLQAGDQVRLGVSGLGAQHQRIV